MLLNRWAFEGSEANSTQLVVPVVLSLNLSMARRAVEEQFKPSSVFARLAPHTVTEARERPLEHQTSVFSAIPCNQLITTWIPDPQPATEPFSHLRQTQGGP